MILAPRAIAAPAQDPPTWRMDRYMTKDRRMMVKPMAIGPRFFMERPVVTSSE